MAEDPKTYEKYLDEVKYNYTNISNVPDEFITEEMCIEAVNQDMELEHGRTLSYIPEKFRTEDVCLEAVKLDGGNFKYVPKKLITFSFCRHCVELNPYVIRSIPERFATHRLCLYAVKYQTDLLSDCIPESRITTEFMYDVVRIDYTALSYAESYHVITPELCLYALQWNAKAYKHIPKRFLTEEFCLTALERNPKIFCYLPPEIKALTRPGDEI